MITMTIDNDHLLPVTDLVDRPGASRPLDLRLPVPEGLEAPLVGFVPPARLHGVAESVVDGILVRGTVSIRLSLACARCLVPLEADVETPVTELFSNPGELPPTERDELEAGYELLDGVLDLETLLRDALMTAVPLQPLCTEECGGLCPDCGVRRDDVACECRQDTTDPRWAALEELRLPSSATDNPEE